MGARQSQAPTKYCFQPDLGACFLGERTIFPACVGLSGAVSSDSRNRGEITSCSQNPVAISSSFSFRPALPSNHCSSLFATRPLKPAPCPHSDAQCCHTADLLNGFFSKSKSRICFQGVQKGIQRLKPAITPKACITSGMVALARRLCADVHFPSRISSVGAQREFTPYGELAIWKQIEMQTGAFRGGRPNSPSPHRSWSDGLPPTGPQRRL